MFKMFDTWRARRRTVAELSRLSDRALADIGVARTDIAAVAWGATAARAQKVPVAGRRGVPTWTTHPTPAAA